MKIPLFPDETLSQSALPETLKPTDDQKATAIALRALLLDVVAGNLPAPISINPKYKSSWNTNISFYCETMDEMKALRRYLGGRYKKTISEYTYSLQGTWRGLSVAISTSRTNVCERVKVGTEKVEVKTEATPATYTIETKIVDKFEWVCPEDLGGTPQVNEPVWADTDEVPF